MLPLSTRDRVPFTPPLWADRTPTPVVYLTPASAYGRAVWNRAVMAAGAVPVNAAELALALRDAVRDTVAAADLPWAFGVLDQYAAFLEAQLAKRAARTAAPAPADAPPAPSESPALDAQAASPVDEAAAAAVASAAEAAPAEAAPPAESVAFLEDYARLEQLALANSPRYAELNARDRYWWDVAPLLAAQHFVAGWDHVTAADGTPLVFRRQPNGLVPAELLDQLGEGVWWSIGVKAIGLTQISSAEKKS